MKAGGRRAAHQSSAPPLFLRGARSIRRAYDAGGVTVSDLVRRFGLSQSHIYNILGRPDERQMKMF